MPKSKVMKYTCSHHLKPYLRVKKEERGRVREREGDGPEKRQKEASKEERNSQSFNKIEKMLPSKRRKVL